MDKIKKQTFVFDLDGTICFDGQRINNEIKLAIKQLITDGNQVIFASGRPIRDIMPLIIADPILKGIDLIGGNGSIVRRNNKITNQEIVREDVRVIKRIADEQGWHVLIDGPWNYHYNGIKDNKLIKQVDQLQLAENIGIEDLESIIKIVVIYQKNDDVKAIVREITKKYQVNNYEQECLLDIIPSNMNKYQALVNEFKITNYIAFGNDVNDLELLTNAQSGFCVGKEITGVNIMNIEPNQVDKVIKSFKN